MLKTRDWIFKKKFKSFKHNRIMWNKWSKNKDL